MKCPLRAFAVVAALILGLASIASAQAPAPDPAPPPIPSGPSTKSSPAPNEGFGEEFALTAKTIIYLKGNSTWDTAYDTLVDAFKSLYAYVEKESARIKKRFNEIFQ